MDTQDTPSADQKKQIHYWLNHIVLGLNLCPFAHKPVKDAAVRVVVSSSNTPLDFFADLQLELQRLAETSPGVLETTLIATPNLFTEFSDYNHFLTEVDWFLERMGWQGTFQVASFHPQYQFADTTSDDPANYTNRSPYPIFHLLREDSLSEVLNRHEDPDLLAQRNIETLRRLTEDERQKLFYYLLQPPE